MHRWVLSTWLVDNSSRSRLTNKADRASRVSDRGRFDVGLAFKDYERSATANLINSCIIDYGRHG